MCGVALLALLPQGALDAIEAAAKPVDHSSEGENSLPPASPAALAFLGCPSFSSLGNFCREALKARGPDVQQSYSVEFSPSAQLLFTGSVLHLRGVSGSPVAQPRTFSPRGIPAFLQSLCPPGGVDVFCWNGEIFGGPLNIGPSESDTLAIVNRLQEIVESSLASLAAVSPLVALNSLREIVQQKIFSFFSSLEGPYAFLYYNSILRTLFYSRDPQGRRSLLVATGRPGLLAIASRALDNIEEKLAEQGISLSEPLKWQEISNSGIFSLDFSPFLLEGKSPVLRHFYWPHVVKNPKNLQPFPCEESSFFSHSPSLQSDCLQFPRLPVEGNSFSPFDEDFSSHLCLTREDFHQKWLFLKESYEKNHPIPFTQLPIPLQTLYYLISSVRIRVLSTAQEFSPERARIGLLFSGGIDCMILARLTDLILPPGEPIELLNASFLGDLRENSAQNFIPDRLTAILGLEELKSLSPQREFRLIHINIRLSAIEQWKSHISSLLIPQQSIMDFNISTILFFAARGKGKILLSTRENQENPGNPGNQGFYRISPHYSHLTGKSSQGPGKQEKPEENEEILEEKTEEKSGKKGKKEKKKKKPVEKNEEEGGEEENIIPQLSDYLSLEDIEAPADEEFYEATARILLVGIGADEQFAGYGRHRTVFRQRGLSGLSDELCLDLKRLWRRNLGRDDRITADSGREMRHPFLDEKLLQFTASLPVSQLCDLTAPPGIGDKRLLRICGALLRLSKSSTLVKRAMQFGSRIANRRAPGYLPFSNAILLNSIVNPAFLRPDHRDVEAERAELKGKFNKKNSKAVYIQQQREKFPM